MVMNHATPSFTTHKALSFHFIDKRIANQLGQET